MVSFLRLTTDVQSFKSAFKHCVSQGLRSATQVCNIVFFAIFPQSSICFQINTFLPVQIIGCAGALISVSPHLTGMIMVVVPSVIVFGTYLGSLLRKLSSSASAQVSPSLNIP